jgi:hypothetical protein
MNCEEKLKVLTDACEQALMTVGKIISIGERTSLVPWDEPEA